MRAKRILGIVAVISTLMSGCGGGGGSDTSSATQISGTAATGAAFNGASVSIIDKTGAVVGSGTTGADGSFTITLTAGAVAPFVLQAVRDDMTLVSVAPDASSTATNIVNITPITNLIASRLSTSGDPTKLAAELKTDPSLLASVKVTAKVNEIVAVLKPLLDAVGATANPLTGKFTADGTGLDRALDSLSITITPDSPTTSNIEVAIKQLTSDGIQPEVRQFTNTTATLPLLPAVNTANLVPAGTAPLIADLMARITACYALPVTDRVDVPNPTTATASAIKAPACKSIFHNDDPTTYKSNGKLVGKGSNTSFGSIYTTSGNNYVFDRGSYLFTRANGDLVVAFRATDNAGNVTYDNLVARTGADGKLHIIGNQYDYGGGVVPYQQLREFLNQPAATYYSTGYDFRVPSTNTLSKVVVTLPTGGTITLVNNGGSANMVIQKNGSPSNTSYLRLRGEYADTANAGNPAAADTNLVFASPRSTDTEISSIPQQSMWKFDYYLTGNGTATPDATQYYKTVGRALTIAEMKKQPLANLADGPIADLRSGSSATGTYPLNFAGPVELEWTVPTAALAPTSIKIFGRGPLVSGSRQSFDDSATVGSTARTGKIFCTSQSVSDNHCATVNGVTNYASGGFFNGLHLFAADASLHEFAHYYATYTVTIP